MASQKPPLPTQLRVDICQSVKVATVRRCLFHLITEKYVEADERQLRSKVSHHNFFHTNQHLKYQALLQASWQHGR